ncbi:unnamed protein product [Closterium sp. Yama58-4]|nr:unnamed protein product [Closterium sp. Yama58-4]
MGCVRTMKLRRPYTSEPYTTPPSPQRASRQPSQATSTEPDTFGIEWEVLDSVAPAFSSPVWIVTGTVDAYVFCVEQRGFPLQRVQVLVDRSECQEFEGNSGSKENLDCRTASGDPSSGSSQRSSNNRLNFSNMASNNNDAASPMLTILCDFPATSHASSEGNAFHQTTGRRFKLPPDAVAEDTTAMQTATGSLVVAVPRSPSINNGSSSNIAPFDSPSGNSFRPRYGQWTVHVASAASSAPASSEMPYEQPAGSFQHFNLELLQALRV